LTRSRLAGAAGSTLAAALAVSAFATLGASASQAAEPAFDAFAQTCMAGDAAPAGVVAAADQAGWTKGGAAGAPISGFTVTASDTRTKHDGDMVFSLYTWTGAKGPITASECQLQASSANLAALTSAVGAKIGVPSAQTSAAKTTFQFAGPLSAPKALAAGQSMDEVAAGDGLYILTVSAAGKGAFVEILKIKK
jgi:hypothetical protein